MKKDKKFDCVEMKWDIQKQIDEEFSTIPEKEARRIHQERIAANPILRRFFKKEQVVKTSHH